MLSDLMDWISFRTWLELVCFAAGLLVLAPFALSRRARKWLSRLDLDGIEVVGFVVLAWRVSGSVSTTALGAVTAPNYSFEPNPLRGSA